MAKMNFQLAYVQTSEINLILWSWIKWCCLIWKLWCIFQHSLSRKIKRTAFIWNLLFLWQIKSL